MKYSQIRLHMPLFFAGSVLFSNKNGKKVISSQPSEPVRTKTLSSIEQRARVIRVENHSKNTQLPCNLKRTVNIKKIRARLRRLITGSAVSSTKTV